MNEGWRMSEGGNRIGRELNVNLPGAAPSAAVPSAPWKGAAGQGGAAASGLASWTQAADSVAAGLQRRAADLTAAATAASTRRYEARSADGSITVTVDGQPRLTSIRIAQNAAGSAPGELARALADTANSALEDARRGTQALLGGADRALEVLISDAAGVPGGDGRSPAATARSQAAARETIAASADNSITATVSGLLKVVSLELSQNASRRDRQAQLGGAVAEVVNAAIAASERATLEQLGLGAPASAPDPGIAGKAALDALTARMGLLLSELDRIGSDLEH